MKRKHSIYNEGKILVNVSRIVSSSLDMDKVAEAVLDESMTALGADHASLFLMDSLDSRLVLTKAKGFSGDEVGNIKILGSWEVINDQLVRKKKALIVNDVHTNPIFRRKSLPFFHEKLPIYSFLAVPLKKDKLLIGVLIVSNRKRPDHIFTKADQELLLGLSNYIAIALMNAKLYQELKDLFISTVKSLVRAVDAKDAYTRGHSERVMKYAVSIGKVAGLDENSMENLRLSSLLHDIGKIGIKESVLYKPGKLSKREKLHIMSHPMIGLDIVESIDNSHKFIRGIVEHHEHFDGSGYPNHLKGQAISILGRIIAVADTYDALTTNRPYQKKYTPKEALFVIRDGSNTQFDPKIVRMFMLSFSNHPEIWQ
ncbi:MAG: HD domain-containing phosphohydrolase [Candidatus Omnitrophota bacterium]|jgi:HD-GYP domain-containing protein (c-di-GMP phosphodiesterase class II)